jgi:hypothetical protein
MQARPFDHSIALDVVVPNSFVGWIEAQQADGRICRAVIVRHVQPPFRIFQSDIAQSKFWDLYT